jgi:hypothetical protein
MDIIPLDIVERLTYRGFIIFQREYVNEEFVIAPRWSVNPPIVKILGREGHFCTLYFDFGSDACCYAIYIKDVIELIKILKIASAAIKNYSMLATRWRTEALDD